MKTVRRRSGQAFVGLRASITRGDLDEQAQNVAEAYVQWESQPLTLYNGARIASGYVLWLPESLLVQPSTDGLLLGDAPAPPEPPPPDLDLRALRYDLDQQIDYVLGRYILHSLSDGRAVTSARCGSQTRWATGPECPLLGGDDRCTPRETAGASLPTQPRTARSCRLARP